MAFPRIAFSNILRSAASVTASSTASGFAVSSAYDFKAWSLWKSGTLVTGITIDIDMGSSADWANVLGLVNHNLTSEVGSIEVKADNATPPVTVRIAAYTPTYGDVELKDLTSHAASRYYRITLTKGGNFTNYPFVGEIFLGNVMTLPEYPQPDLDPWLKQTEAVTQASEGGQYLGAVVRGRAHRFDISCSDAGMVRSFLTSDLNAFVDGHYDLWRPFIYQLDSADSDFQRPFYVVKPPDAKHSRMAVGGVWSRIRPTIPAVEAYMESA